MAKNRKTASSTLGSRQLSSAYTPSYVMFWSAKCHPSRTPGCAPYDQLNCNTLSIAQNCWRCWFVPQSKLDNSFVTLMLKKRDQWVIKLCECALLWKSHRLSSIMVFSCFSNTLIHHAQNLIVSLSLTCWYNGVAKTLETDSWQTNQRAATRGIDVQLLELITVGQLTLSPNWSIFSKICTDSSTLRQTFKL